MVITMNHKFTLCCNKGRLFKPSTHFLILDRWLVPPENTSILILAHGIMSEQEYNTINQSVTVPIYQSVTGAWIGIYASHRSKKFVDVQLVGELKRFSRVMFGGVINVK